MRLKNKNVLFFTKLIVFGALFMMILPFILFGENNYITVHDNLDQFPPFWSIAKKVGLFSFDVSTGVMDNTPAVYFGWGGFTIQNFAYYLLPAYVAYVLTYLISLLVGFFSMYKLQCILFGKEHREILLFTSLLFAILPVIPAWSISVASIPLACIVFYHIYKVVAVGGTFPPLLDGVSLQCFVCLWLLVSGYGYRFNKKQAFSLHTICGILTVMHWCGDIQL